jgi:hypothetical protein
MSEDKLRASFKACRGPYPWSDFVRLLQLLGYAQLKTGKTTGSRRKYYNAQIDHLVMLHEPHGKEMGRGLVRAMQKSLKLKGVL